VTTPTPGPQNPYKQTDGTLTIGEAGTLADFSRMVTACSIETKVDAEDAQPVLSGNDLPGERNYTYTLKATFLQDLGANGLVQFCHANKGKQLPFLFVPAKSEGVKITGSVIVDPVTIGGDVKKRNTTDAELELVGEPAFGTLTV